MGRLTLYRSSLLLLTVFLPLAFGTSFTCTSTSTQNLTIVENSGADNGNTSPYLIHDFNEELTSSSLFIIPHVLQHSDVFYRYFSIEMGRLSTNGWIDREAIARDLMNPYDSVQFMIDIVAILVNNDVRCFNSTLHIRDLDDNVPTFTVEDNAVVNFNEDDDVADQQWPLSHAVDDDELGNGTSEYELVDDSGKFELVFDYYPNTPRVRFLHLRNTEPLDREERATYDLMLRASEGNDDPDTATLNFQVVVTETCDETPVLPTSYYQPSLPEDAAPNTLVLTLIATDPDDPTVCPVTYVMDRVCARPTVSHNCQTLHNEPFTLDSESGHLTLNTELDREEYAEYQITVRARDAVQTSSTATVVLSVGDINDNDPEVRYSGLRNIPEVQAVNADQAIGFVQVTDADEGRNAQVRVRLLDNSTGHLVLSQTFGITIEEDNYKMILNQAVDYESQREYHLVVEATDNGTNPRTTYKPVLISIEDHNDHAPVFHDFPTDVRIREDRVQNDLVTTITAQDSDTGLNAEIRYELPESNETYPYQGLFQIEPELGDILVGAQQLDYEEVTQYTILVVARNSLSSVRLMTSAELTIQLENVNDNRPEFVSPVGSLRVNETAHTGYVIGSVVAVDADNLEPLVYSITSESSPFSITEGGVISLVGALDYEMAQNHSITVEVTDSELVSEATVTIDVLPVNDEPPVFDVGRIVATVYENEEPDTYVATIAAEDRDVPPQELQFQILQGEHMERFRIESSGESSANIYTAESLDRETTPNYTLYVQVDDGEMTSGLKEVFIMVGDVNDHTPEFIGVPYVFEITENNAPNQMVGEVEVLSLDQGNNQTVMFRFSGGNSNHWFSINPTTGVITTNNTVLDRETILSPIELQVEVRDLGIVSRVNVTNIRVIVTDQNDNPPTFPNDMYFFTIREDYPIGQVFGAVQAHDPDGTGHNETIYRFSEETRDDAYQFNIDESTGHLNLVASLDFETSSSVTFTIIATDADRGDYQTSTTVFINVTNARDLNLTLPEGFSPHFSVYENIEMNYTITRFEVRDTMLNSVDRLIYTLTTLENTPSPEFGIRKEGYTAVIYTRTNSIDREAEDLDEDATYKLKLNVSDPDTSEDSYGYIVSFLTIEILDENDNAPVFEPSPEEYFVEENGAEGQLVARLEAKDRDEGANGTIRFTIDAGLPFNVTREEQSGRQYAVIRVLHSLNREIRSSYSFFVIATDMGTPQPLDASTHVIVTVIDVNDNPPVICEQPCTYHVREDLELGGIVGTVIATDDDDGSFGQVRYEVAPGSLINTAFALDGSTGEITLVETLDREMEDEYTFSVRAIDGGDRAATGTITIIVTDVNEYSPDFVNSSFTVSIPENLDTGVPFTSLVAVDQDTASNGVVNYALADNSLSKIFCLDEMTGEVSICDRVQSTCVDQEVIDYERQNEYRVEIIAYDHGVPRRFSNQTLTVQITNYNEHYPKFDSSELNILVSENTPPGSSVLDIQAYDLDANDELHYEIIAQGPGNYFLWDDDTNSLVLARQPNYDDQPMLEAELRAVDRANHHQDLFIIVYVLNENTHGPVFETEDTTVYISESAEVMSGVIIVRATDADNRTNDAVTYSISDGNTDQSFAISPKSGALYVDRALDYENQSTYTLIILATDTGEPAMVSEPLTITVQIVDENDEVPIFTESEYTFHLTENNADSTLVGCVSAPDRDEGEYGVVLYSIIGEGDHEGYFTINENTGCIYSLQQIDRERISQFQLEIQAQDEESPSKSATATVNVVIDDVNDNGPMYSQETFLFYIPPDYDISGVIGTIAATDTDSGDNAQLFYNITEPDSTLVAAYLQNGDLKLETPIPFPYQPSYSIGIRVAASVSGDTRYDDAVVKIVVESQNDNHPRFTKLAYEERVSESAEVGHTVFDASEVITDDDGTSGIEFAFVDNYPEFALDTESGLITLQQMLNYEEINSYELKVRAIDNFSSLTRTATATVRVIVEDGNDHAPVFINPPTQITLSRVPYNNIELFTVVAEDEDVGDHGTVGYSIVEDSNNAFQIDAETGVVTNRVNLMTDGHYSFVIRAFDRGSPLKSSNITVIVEIHEPENPPQFVNGDTSLVIRLPEDEETPSEVQRFMTSPSAESYHIVYSNASQDMFSINSDNFLVLESDLKYETASQYMLIIEARNINTNGYRLSSFLLVNIVVTDVNNYAPEFTHLSTQEISESQATNTVLFQVRATDIDSGSNGEVTYAISGGNIGNVFDINSASGEVSLVASLDRETTASYDLDIRAMDGGLPDQQYSMMTVKINVLDVDDNAPTFSPENYTISVYEFPHTVIGDSIIQIMAEDRDLGPPLNYRLQIMEGTFMGARRNPSSDTFTIGYDTGNITTHRNLNREEIDRYVLRIEARDSIPEHNTVTYLTVHVLDVNDHTPRFTHTELQVDIYELRPVNWLVLDSLSAEDSDIGQNGLIKYSLGNGWPVGFKIDQWTGVIRMSQQLGYDTHLHEFSGQVLAVDQGIPARTATTTVEVHFIDVNNNPPVLDSTHFGRDISVNHSLEQTIIKFNYTDDADASFNTATLLRIPTYYTDAHDLFKIKNDKELQLKRKANTADIGKLSFRIEAIQEGIPPCPQYIQTAYAHVTVTIHQENNHAPQFTSLDITVRLPEDTPVGSVLDSMDVDLGAIDADGDQVTYYISSAAGVPFAIEDPKRPSITITSELDADTPSSAMYTVMVEATDNGFPVRTSYNTLTVIVTDVNDLPPQFSSESYSEWVSENSPLNTVVLRVQAVDPDQGVSDDISFEIVGNCEMNCPPFAIDSSGVITTIGEIDYETQSSYFFQVAAMDSRLSSTVPITIDVSGENEFSPQFMQREYAFEVQGGGKGDLVGQVRAVDEDAGEEGVLIYSFVEKIEEPYDVFEINGSTGEIFLTADANNGERSRRKRDVQSSGNTVFVTNTVQARDSGMNPQTATAVVTISVPKTFFDSVGGTAPAETSGSPFEIIIIVVVTVSLVIVIFVGIVVTALIFRRRGKNKKWKVEDAPTNHGNIAMTSERYSHNGTVTPSSQVRHATTTLQTGNSASESERSYTGTADDEMESGNEITTMPRYTSHSPTLPTKSLRSNSPRVRSTSDLASTVCTDAIHSQTESHPYTKAQLMRIYAANEELLDDNVSHDSVHMFGSEGGGEADGDLDINNLIFQKINDLEDDEVSTTIMDDDASTTYSKGRGTVMAGSAGNIDIMPAEEREDPMTYTDSIKTWIPPPGRSVEEAIAEITGTSSFASQEEPLPRRHGYEMGGLGGYSHSQGPSLYGPNATQDSFIGMRSQPKRGLHDYPHHMYYPEEHEDRRPRDHERDRQRYTPRANHRYGSASVLPGNHDYRREPRQHYRSQDLGPPYPKYSPFIPGRRQMGHHSYMTPTDGTDDGTVTPQTALTGEYQYLSSSSTSLTSTNVSGNLSQPSRRGQIFNRFGDQ